MIKKILKAKTIDKLLKEDKAYKIPFSNDLVFVEYKGDNILYVKIDDGKRYKLYIKEIKYGKHS